MMFIIITNLLNEFVINKNNEIYIKNNLLHKKTLVKLFLNFNLWKNIVTSEQIYLFWILNANRRKC